MNVPQQRSSAPVIYALTILAGVVVLGLLGLVAYRYLQRGTVSSAYLLLAIVMLLNFIVLRRAAARVR